MSNQINNLALLRKIFGSSVSFGHGSVGHMLFGHGRNCRVKVTRSEGGLLSYYHGVVGIVFYFVTLVVCGFDTG
jgi:hypothetical protein